MDINQAPAKSGDRCGWDALQVSREDDQPGIAHRANELGGVRGIGEDRHGDIRPPRPLQRRAVRTARHDPRDACDRGVPPQGVEQRLEVGAAARNQRRHRNRRHRVQGASAAGFGPAVTVRVNAPVARRSRLVVTMR